MNINKKLGLLALPLVAAGAIGIAVVGGTPRAHAATPSMVSEQQSAKDTPEPNDTPDSGTPGSTKSTDSSNEGTQTETGAPDVNQADGETAN